MTEHIEKEAAKTKLQGVINLYRQTYTSRVRADVAEFCLKKVMSIPAADVRPVIFCEDCDNWNEWDHSGRESLGNFLCSCAYWSVEDGPVFFTAPTDFCSYAEPKMAYIQKG